MIFLAIYLCIGLIFGACIVFRALIMKARPNKFTDLKRAESFLSEFKAQPFRFIILSAFGWPLYIKWWILGE